MASALSDPSDAHGKLVFTHCRRCRKSPARVLVRIDSLWLWSRNCTILFTHSLNPAWNTSRLSDVSSAVSPGGEQVHFVAVFGVVWCLSFVMYFTVCSKMSAFSSFFLLA